MENEERSFLSHELTQRQPVQLTYDSPFRDVKSLYSGPYAEGDEMEMSEATAGYSGANEDGQIAKFHRDSRFQSQEEPRMDQMEGMSGDPGVVNPNANEAESSHYGTSNTGAREGSSAASHPLEIRDGSVSTMATTSDQSTVDVVVHGSPQSASSVPTASAKSLKLSPTLEYVSALAHLTTFGILGVYIRYGLEIFFSANANVTADDSPLFIDLPANMLGCFFMGWVGVVLKKDIAMFSELLAIGLSTGLMGSITTYASWNQQMLSMMTNGLWVRSIVGLLIGMELSQVSLTVGMDSAKLLQSSISYVKRTCGASSLRRYWSSSPDNLPRRKISMLVFLTTSLVLWVGAVVLTVIDTSSLERRRLWLACVVGPPGVWARWLLARLNGQGIGPKRHLKWLPIGTLLTNLVASTLEAILAVVLVATPDDATLLVKGLQIGLLGCMSTVSTFVVEIYALHQSPKRWRAYAYAGATLFCTFAMGALVYTLPVLTHYT